MSIFTCLPMSIILAANTLDDMWHGPLCRIRSRRAQFVSRILSLIITYVFTRAFVEFLFPSSRNSVGNNFRLKQFSPVL